jgi:acid phosphatase (class A)
MTTCPPGSIGTYPETDWSDDHRPLHGTRPTEPIKFQEVELTLPDPAKLVGKTNECEYLKSLMALRASLMGPMGVEASRVHQAVASVLAAVGVSTDVPFVNLELKALRKFIVSEIEPPIFQMKWKFMRARPWTCCGSELKPLFTRPHWLYPGHPSYPSGTATAAWVFAYLVGDVVPKYQAALERAAADVARRREIAGVHYPSDSEAGRLLARQLVDAMHTSTNATYKKQIEVIKKWIT